MFRYWRITLPAILLLVLVFSCSKSTKNENGGGDTEDSLIDFTPKENEEAELIALCLSGELVAPDSLYEQIVSDLAAIRTTFGDTFEMVNQITFFPPWMASYLVMAFYDSAAQLIEAGEYEAWNELNQKYHVTEIKTHYIKYGCVSLVFEGRLNPFRLEEYYVVLPGVWYAEPNFWNGDWPNVYSRQTDLGFSYLFRYASGDCTVGCTHNEYWYFVCEDGDPVFIGYWAPKEEPDEPDWWEEARLNREHYCDP